MFDVEQEMFSLAVRHMVTRYLSSDASPQAKCNFFCALEEVLTQALLFQPVEVFNAFQHSPCVDPGKGRSVNASQRPAFGARSARSVS